MTNTTFNPDAMSVEELSEWSRKPRGVRPIAEAAEFFGGKPKGFVRAFRGLVCYGSNKATAMECRLRGDIQSALMYEGICDRIYESLPEYAKW